jgi:hypothetical protein
MSNTSNCNTFLSGREKAKIAHRIFSHPKIKAIELSLNDVSGFFAMSRQSLHELLNKYPKLPSQPESVTLNTKLGRTDSDCEGILGKKGKNA